VHELQSRWEHGAGIRWAMSPEQLGQLVGTALHHCSVAVEMATSTFSPSNSSLHTWLTWDLATIPVLPKCQINSVDVNCTQVCNNSEALFTSQSNNLVTCGLWTTLVTEHSQPGPYSDPNKTVDWTNNTVAEYIDEFFPGTGLNLGDFQNAAINASMYADTISNCLEDMYNNVKDWSFSDNGFTPAACTRQELFPIGPGNSSLKDCLQAICSPLTLNPDLAGIGVSPASSRLDR